MPILGHMAPIWERTRRFHLIILNHTMMQIVKKAEQVEEFDEEHSPDHSRRLLRGVVS